MSVCVHVYIERIRKNPANKNATLYQSHRLSTRMKVSYYHLSKFANLTSVFLTL